MSESILIFDIETSGLNVDKDKLKWFGAYSYLDNKYYLLDYKKNCQIEDLIKKHKILIGYNCKGFDQPFLERYLKNKELFKFKIILDYLEISAPKGDRGYGKYNKQKLPAVGINLKNYSLKNVIDALKLDKTSKEDINYKIFQKDKWNSQEIIEIEKYLKQDIHLTKKLHEWYEEQFEPIKKYLNSEDVRKKNYIKESFQVIGYKAICNLAGLPVEWTQSKPEDHKTFEGGHRLFHRWDLVKGKIIEIDFSSAYPHALIMGNLFSNEKTGWTGSEYYTLDGTYNSQQMGKIETAFLKLLSERLKAKKDKDKVKDKSLKLIINASYGLAGAWKYTSLYNITTASDCTSIARTWMKKLAKTLEEYGFIALYGFTDSIFVKLPEESNKEELMYIVNKFIKEALSKTPFPLDSFKMDIEEEIKMIWFLRKNCYLFVTEDNKVKYKHTLLDQNTPKAVMNIFKDYIQPKIIKELDINFTTEEFEKEFKKLFNKNFELACEEYKVSPISEYKSKTSLQYQISEKYGDGRHFLIPNLKGIGIGRQKLTKKKVGVRYCTVEEFSNNKLTIEDIDTSQLMKHLKPFIINKEFNK